MYMNRKHIRRHERQKDRRHMAKWRSSLYGEDRLKSLKIPFQVITVPIKSLNLNTSSNQARLGAPLDKMLIKDYSESMRNGDIFPRIFAHCVNGKTDILGGHHTAAAYKSNGEKDIELYNVQTNDQRLLNILPGILNPPRREQSREERLILAGHSVRNDGMSVPEACKEYKLTKSSLTEKLRAEKLEGSLAKLGVDTRKLKPSAILALSPLASYNDNVFREAADACTKLDVQSARSLTKIVQNVSPKDEWRQIAAIKQFAKNTNTTGKNQTFLRVNQAITTLESSIKNGHTLHRWGITYKADKEAFGKRIGELCRGLKKICSKH